MNITGFKYNEHVTGIVKALSEEFEVQLSCKDDLQNFKWKRHILWEWPGPHTLQVASEISTNINGAFV